MEKSRYRVPLMIYFMIPLLLAGMYYYAAYVDTPAPEDVVINFYDAYADQNYTGVAENISVFWAAGILPEYSVLPPEELLSERDKIEKDMADFFTTAEKGRDAPENLSIEIRSEYTKIGKLGALVLYDINDDDTTLGTELAMLIKEDRNYYILNFYPIDPNNLKYIQEFDIGELDSSLEELLS